MTSVSIGPRQLALLTAIVDEYCGSNGLPAGSERERVALIVLKLFEEGHASPEELKLKLIQAMLQDELDRHAPS